MCRTPSLTCVRMDVRDLKLSRLAARQNWVVSRAQLLGLGFTARQIEGRVRAKALAGVHRKVYRITSAVRTEEQELMAACLATGGVASHRAAAKRYGLRGIESAPIEITVSTRGTNRLEGVVVHRAPIESRDRTRIGVLPVTRPALTILGISAVAPDLLEGAVEDALFRGLITAASLRDVLDRWGARGRDGTVALRRLLEARDPEQAPTESALEDQIVAVLRRYGLPEPTRQHKVPRPGRRSLRLDVAYLPEKVNIEGDGMRWHAGTRQAERDRERDNYLVALGWLVLRYTKDQVRRAPVQLAGQVDSVLAARRAALLDPAARFLSF